MSSRPLISLRTSYGGIGIGLGSGFDNRNRDGRNGGGSSVESASSIVLPRKGQNQRQTQNAPVTAPPFVTPPSPPATETDSEPESPGRPFSPCSSCLPAPSPSTDVERDGNEDSDSAADAGFDDACDYHQDDEDNDYYRHDSLQTLYPEPVCDSSSYLSATFSSPTYSNQDIITSSPLEPEPTTAARSATFDFASAPPYWLHGQHFNRNPNRVSTSSFSSIAGNGIITLRDNELEGDEFGVLDHRNRGCWAKNVDVTDFVTVDGGPGSVGAYVAWNIRVETFSGTFLKIRKRYSEFDDFRWRLIRTFPGFEAAVPDLPPKSIISNFRPRFLEKRRAGLQYFLNCILLNPEFSGSPVLKDFLFS